MRIGILGPCDRVFHVDAEAFAHRAKEVRVRLRVFAVRYVATVELKTNADLLARK